MKNAVHPAVALSQTVEHRADGIDDAAGEDPQQSGEGDSGQGGLQGNDDTPAHADVADHAQRGILFQINGGEGGAQSGKPPDQGEQRPAPAGVYGTDGGEDHRRIGPGDQKIDGAVIQYLQDLFAGAGV